MACLLNSSHHYSLLSREQVMWRLAQYVVSLRLFYKFVNFNSTIVICLKSCIMCFYWNVRSIYYIHSMVVTDFVLGLVCCVNYPHHNLSLWQLVVILVSITVLTWFKDIYQHTMYAMGIYIRKIWKNIYYIVYCLIKRHFYTLKSS